MSKVLILVKENANEWRPEVVFDGSRRAGHVVRTLPYNEERHPAQHELFEIDEVDVDAALEHLTRNFPSRSVGVYRMEKEGIRPPAEMVLKNVTKDGVFP